MATRIYKRMTAGQRNKSVSDFAEITTTTPEKSLLVAKRKNGGRNASGKITVRHRGGGNRQFYRLVDFRRLKDNVQATVRTIEYDPNRSARIALIQYRDGLKSYILAPMGLAVGDILMNGASAEIRIGNHMPLRNIPEGTTIHNVELTLGRGGQIGRSAGMSIQLMAKDGDYAVVVLPSGEQRRVHADCRATIGQMGNPEEINVVIGKAGRKRHMGWRPVVRGAVMNPNDHPHGGGEGRAPVGRKNPRDIWGNVAYGVKSRDPKKSSNQYIIRRRKNKRMNEVG